MDMTPAREEFLKSLSNDEWGDADCLSYLGQALYSNLTEDENFRFVQAGVERKRANPDSRGIEEINAGLAAIGKPPIIPAPKKRTPTVRKRVRGV